MQESISIVILNYNGQRWLQKCLDSLYSQTLQPQEIILVDNASTDGSQEYLRQNYPKVKLICSQKNVGFAGGNNLGIKNALGKYVMILNNDTWVESDFLEKLWRFYGAGGYDVVSVLESKYDQLEIKLKNFSTKIDPVGYPILLENPKQEYQFNLCGLCLLFNKDFYWQTQGLDDNFFIYLEEIDWFWRLKLLNKKIGLCKDLYLYHYGSGDVGQGGLRYNVFLWRNQNHLQMILKNCATTSLIIVLPIYFIQNLVEIVFFVLILKPKIAWTYIAGWIFNVRHLKATLKKRAWVQSNRLISETDFIQKNVCWIPGKLVHLIQVLKHTIK